MSFFAFLDKKYLLKITTTPETTKEQRTKQCDDTPCQRMTRDGMKEQDSGRSMSKVHRSSSPEWMPEEGEEHELRLLKADNEELTSSPPSTDVFLPPPQSWFGLDEEEDEKDGGGSDDHVTSALSSSGSSSRSSRSGDDEQSVEDSGEPLCFRGMEELKRQIGSPKGAPSWSEHATETLPLAARELISASLRRAYYFTRISYATGGYGKRYLRHSDLGNAGGYFRPASIADRLSVPHSACSGKALGDEGHVIDLPPFSSLPWVDRQLVQEWRTCDHTFEPSPEHRPIRTATSPMFAQVHQNGPSIVADQPYVEEDEDEDEDDEEDIGMEEEENDVDYDRARTLVPQAKPPPKWENSETCHSCRRTFGPTLLRHHCRLCGHSYCHSHSAWTHRLPHLGYDANVPERVCDICKRKLDDQNLAERVAWRLARCRDYLDGDLVPYFETGVDTMEDAALRLTQAAIAMARSIPLGAQAHVAVETIEVLRKHGLKGVYGLVLRKEFMAAADLLCRALGINKTAWPLSVHELSAAIFYALAQHKAIRGMDPEREHLIHTLKQQHHEETKDMAGTSSASEQRHVNVPDDGDESHAPGLDERWSNSGGEKFHFEDWGPFVSGLPSDSKSRVYIEDYEAGDTVILSAIREEEEDGGGDTIVWNDMNKNRAAETTVLDETDVYNPMTENVTNVNEMANYTTSRQQEGRNDTSGSPEKSTHNGIDASAESESCANKSQTIIEGESEPMEDSEEFKRKLPFTPVCEHVSDALISSLIFYAPMALNFIYATAEVDMQLLAAQQGWRLLYAHLEQDAGSHATDRPASALFVHSRQKIACLTIRGTATIHDVVTDIRAMPVPFPEVDPDAPGESNDTCEDDWTPIFRGHGLALCGMAKASANLFRENIDTLLLLAQKGYRIRITGHSLGGGVAALLGALVLRHFEKNARQGSPLAAAFEKRKGSAHAPGNNSSETNGISNLLRVYGYGTPSCVDAALSDYVRSFVTTVVMHDDVIPRLTPTSIRGLLKHLLHIRETWVKTHLTNDLMAITERARGVWAPRWRGSFTLLKSPSRLKGYYKKKILISKRKLQSLGTSSSHDQTMSCGESVHKNRADHDHVSSTSGTLELTCGHTEKEEQASDGGDELEQVSNTEYSKSDDGDDEVSQDTTGIYIDGDEFFEAEDTLVESDDETLEGNRLEDNRLVGSEQELKSDLSNSFPCNTDDWNPFGETSVPFGESLPSLDTAVGGISHSAAIKVAGNFPQQKIEDIDVVKYNNETLKEKSIPAVVLEEAPLPRMFLPGKIVHIYTHRGGYKATYVPRAFRELRRISLAGNMLNDHISKAYYEGLLEVQSVRKAAETLPQWTGFAEDSTCSCCASLFTWASTSDSEAQAARDKHNCRSCGTLVCDPCSKNRLPLPSVGITVPVRVCDRCYNDIGGALTGDSGNGLARSFLANTDAGDGNVEFIQTAVEVNEPGKDRAISDVDGTSKVDEVKAHIEKMRPQRQRQRRSIVVDELASRIHPSVPSH